MEMLNNEIKRTIILRGFITTTNHHIVFTMSFKSSEQILHFTWWSDYLTSEGIMLNVCTKCYDSSCWEILVKLQMSASLQALQEKSGDHQSHKDTWAQDKWKQENPVGSPKSEGLIIWGPWTFVQNFMAINPTVIKIFQPGQEQWTEQLTHVAIPGAMPLPWWKINWLIDIHRVSMIWWKATALMFKSARIISPVLIISCLLSPLISRKHKPTTGCDTKFILPCQSERPEKDQDPSAEVLIWQHCSLQLSDSPAASAQLSEETHAPLSSFPWLSVWEQRCWEQTARVGMKK